MEGALELAEEVFHMPVRLGMPQHVDGLAKSCATRFTRPASGCCMYGSQIETARAEPVIPTGRAGSSSAR